MSYGKVHEEFWIDEKMSAASDGAKLLALYLISGPHRNAIGCSRIPAQYIAADMRWDQRKVAAAIAELRDMGFITRDDATGWTLVNNFLRYDPIRGDKAAIGASRLASIVPKSLNVYSALYERLSPVINQELKAQGDGHQWTMQPPSMGDARPSDDPSKDTRSPEPSPIPYQSLSPAGAGEIDLEFETWWAAYPRKEGKADALKAYRSARKTADQGVLLAACERYARSRLGEDPKFTKGPGAWLRAERWRDGERSAPTGPPARLETPEERRALEARLREQFEAQQEAKRLERRSAAPSAERSAG